MNKIINLCVIFFIIGCNSKLIPPKSEHLLTGKQDTILFWRVDDLKKAKYYSYDEMHPLSVVKKKYKINKGKLFDEEHQEVVSNIMLQLRTDTLMGQNVEIRDGLPFGAYCDFTDGVTCKKDIHYDDNGNIDDYFSVHNYNTKFIKGNGFWKDYYSINRKYFLKEEGEVRNNFKFGEWKYYNKKGKIDSIKTYTIKDSVDVRFPHCIFNKNEKCY